MEAHIQVQPYHERSGDATGTKDDALPWTLNIICWSTHLFFDILQIQYYQLASGILWLAFFGSHIIL